MVKKKSITIKDIAAEAGVSPALVSFVMNNSQSGTHRYRVCEATAQKILEIAAKYNYRSNSLARSLRVGRTNTIGVLLSDIANPFFAEIARNLEDMASKRGYGVVFGSTDEKNEKMSKLISLLLDKGVDGLIIVPNDGSDDVIGTCVNSGHKVVLLDRDITNMDLDCVALDNYRTSQSLMSALFEKGCKKTVMVSYAFRASNMIQREDGYVDAMRAAGHEADARIIRYHHNAFETVENDVAEAINDGADSFLIATNTLAYQTVTKIVKAGYDIPSQVRVATFDYNNFFDMMGFDIIYASQPIAQFASEALDLIIRKIEGEEHSDHPVKITLLPKITKEKVR